VTGNDWFNSRLRPAEKDREEQPAPDFDGGARTTIPPKPPSMNVLIRRAVFGDVAGLTPRPDGPDAA